MLKQLLMNWPSNLKVYSCRVDAILSFCYIFPLSDLKIVGSAGVLENIDNLTKETRKIKASKEKLKVWTLKFKHLKMIICRDYVVLVIWLLSIMQSLEEDYERTLQDEAKDLEQLLNKRNIFLSKQEDCMKKIRDLGSLPSDAFDT